MKCLHQICFRKKDAWLTRTMYLLHVIDKTIDWRISIFSCGSFERWTRNYIKFWIRSKAQLHRVLRGGLINGAPPPPAVALSSYLCRCKFFLPVFFNLLCSRFVLSSTFLPKVSFLFTFCQGREGRQHN